MKVGDLVKIKVYRTVYPGDMYPTPDGNYTGTVAYIDERYGMFLIYFRGRTYRRYCTQKYIEKCLL